MMLIKEDHVRTSCTSWRREQYRHVLFPSRPGAPLPCLSSPSHSRPPRFPFYSSCPPLSPNFLGQVSIHCSCCPPYHPTPIPLDTTHGGCAVLATQLSLILVPPCHERIAWFEDPPGPLPRHFYRSGPPCDVNSNHQGRKFR